MAVLRCALVEERGLRSVLRRPVGTAGRDQIQGVECDGADHVDRAVEQIGDGVGRADRRRTLQHDVARIEFLVHQVRREPDFFFAVDQSPDERGESRVLGQQRIVDVEGAVLGCVEDSAGNQVRQLLATMMSGAASASAALKASSGLFAT